ncbi:MAG: S-layer homology domain-containing protein [Acidimicrobiia bacterium]|nr:S-layer homology domain-containing protein [Acidimicrobiia bacterium]
MDGERGVAATTKPSASRWATLVACAALLIGLTTTPGVADDDPAPTFTDVPADHPFHDDIAWLAATGITTGYPDGTFAPTNPVSRQAMAAFLHRLWDLTDLPDPPLDDPTPTFTDVPADHPFHDDIAWLAATGITTGFPDGTFAPTNPVSRQAMAAFLHRLWDLTDAAHHEPGVLVVNHPGDSVAANPGDGICADAAGNCTLRAAVDEANATDGHHTVRFAPHITTVTLDRPVIGEDEWDHDDTNTYGDLDITDDLTIDGTDVTLDANRTDRALHIHQGDVTISGLTITGGDAGYYGGGGISHHSPGTLALTHVTVTDNRYGEVSADRSWESGGAIALHDGHLVADHLTLTHNRTSSIDDQLDAIGGGLSIWGLDPTDATTVHITNSTISHNGDGPNGGAYRTGGGLHFGGTVDVTIEGTTISHNKATDAPAIFGIGDTSLVLRDSIVSHHTGQATGATIDLYGTTTLIERTSIVDNGPHGGALIVERELDGSGALVVRNSTIAHNATTNIILASYVPTTIEHSTIAANTDTTGQASALLAGAPTTVATSILGGVGPVCHGGQHITSAGYNLSSDDTCGLDQPTDLVDTDPHLGPLDDHGGPTPTMVPAATSPAVDAIPAGTPELCDNTTPADQRGVARPQGAGCDIGAVEREQPVLVVDHPGDSVAANPGDGVCADTAGNCTLRAAVDEANATDGHHTVRFAPHIDTVTLDRPHDGEDEWDHDDTNAYGDLDIFDDLTIDGPDVTLDANRTDRPLHIHQGDVTISGLTITGGDAGYYGGGGIYHHSPGTLTLTDVTITDNLFGEVVHTSWMETSGGGLATHDGHLVAERLTLTHNRLSDIELMNGYGGGLSVWGEGSASNTVTVHIIDSTISHNGETTGDSEQTGGGVSALGDVELIIEDTVISHNEADEEGGAIFLIGAALELRNSTVAHNINGHGAAVALYDPQVIIDTTSVVHNAGGGPAIAAERSYGSGSTGALLLRNSTIASNEGRGVGGIFTDLPTIIEHSTIAGNTTSHDTWAEQLLVWQPTTITASIIAGTGDGPVCHGAQHITSLGYNLSSDDTCGLDHPTDLADTDPQLGPLGDHGGPTPTMVPAATSPAVDAIPADTPELCDDTTRADQRGVERPQSTGCDIGAVERQPGDP